jgi:hypothetical protein
LSYQSGFGCFAINPKFDTPLDNPQANKPGRKTKKSSVLSNQLVSLENTLVSITAAPDKAGDLLVDTGATNHVMSHRQCFVTFQPTNIQLCVASK